MTIIGVALKPVPWHVDVDPLTGTVATSDAPSRTNAADLAALETALRLRGHWGGTVTVACAGGPAEPVLRDALARGADRALHVDVPPGSPGSPSGIARTATALACALADCDAVICGDFSSDGGTGAVPALLAAAGDRAQALGLVHVEPEEAGTVLAERRLDRGRRERLRVRAPMVLSVEGAAAQPRRASLPAVLRAQSTPIETMSTPPAEPESPHRAVPYRPRARALPPPAGTTPHERVLQLLGAASDHEPPRRVDAGPPAAAKEIVDQLHRWGYL